MSPLSLKGQVACKPGWRNPQISRDRVTTRAVTAVQAPMTVPIEWVQAAAPTVQDIRHADITIAYERRADKLMADLQAIAHDTEVESERWAAGIGSVGSEAQYLRRKAELDHMTAHQARIKAAITCLKQLLEEAKHIVHEITLAQFTEEVYLCGRQNDELAVKEFMDFKKSSVEQMQGLDQQLTATMATILGMMATTESLSALLPQRAGSGTRGSPRALQAC